MTALTVVDQPEPVGVNVLAATDDATEPRLTASATTTMPSSATTPAIQPSTSNGVARGRKGLDAESPTSKTSDAPSGASMRRWPTPKNVREFASQANMVATMVLNGTMDEDRARTYSAVARTVAQAMSTEVTRARFLQEVPDLDLPPIEFEMDDDL